MKSRSSTPAVFIAGGASFDTIVHLEQFPDPRPGVVFAREGYQTLGGTSAGKALNLAALGCTVTLAAQIGSDQAGAAIRARLHQAGVTLIELPDVHTEQHVNLMNAKFDRLSIFALTRTFAPEVSLEAFDAAILAADVVMLDIIHWSRALIPRIRAHEKPIWCDLHDYDGQNPYHWDYLEAADVVFFSSEAMPDWRNFMTQTVASGKRLVVATHGARGASALLEDGTWFDQPVKPDGEVVDTNGAGDAFMSGFYVADKAGLNVGACLAFASRVAAECIASRELVGARVTPELLGDSS